MKLDELTLRSENSELREALLEAKKVQPYTPVGNDFFTGYVLKRFLKSYKDIKQFLDTLDKEANDYGMDRCNKASSIRIYLNSPYWAKSFENQLSAVGNCRHIHCMCHSSESFKPHIQYPRKYIPETIHSLIERTRKDKRKGYIILSKDAVVKFSSTYKTKSDRHIFVIRFDKDKHSISFPVVNPDYIIIEGI